MVQSPVQSPRSPNEQKVKILILGDAGVGKTSLMMRYTDETFRPSVLSTIGVDFKSKNVKLDKGFARVQVWDTPGSERFRSLPRGLLLRTHGSIIVYDVTNRRTFDCVEYWLNAINDTSGTQSCTVLVANKCDDENAREVSESEGEECALRYGTPYFETSAASGSGVEGAFSALIDKILETVPMTLPSPDNVTSNAISLTRESLSKSSPHQVDCCGGMWHGKI